MEYTTWYLTILNQQKVQRKKCSVKQLVHSQFNFLNLEYNWDHYHNEKLAAEEIQHENPVGIFNCIPKVESYTAVILALLYGKWHNNFSSLTYTYLLWKNITFRLIFCSRFIFDSNSIVSDSWKTDNFYDWHCVVLSSYQIEREHC